MKILLIGHGKMGQSIEKVASDLGHAVIGSVNTFQDLQSFNLKNVDVAIEFTQPEAAFNNLVFCIRHNIPVVCGTTGWLHQLEEMRKIVQEKGGSVFYASNYSLGVNLFFEAAKMFGRTMKNYPEYEAAIEEIHHTEKKDIPSGTAITLAEKLIKVYPAKEGWVSGNSDDPEKLPIISFREEQVPGTHTLVFESNEDRIEIRHEAKSREGFALGAIRAADWLIGKKGFFGMEDLMKLTID